MTLKASLSNEKQSLDKNGATPAQKKVAAHAIKVSTVTQGPTQLKDATNILTTKNAVENVRKVGSLVCLPLLASFPLAALQ